MAVVEKNGFLKYKDENGDVTLMYPITTKDNVDGMDEIDDHVASTDNPHNVTKAQIGLGNVENKSSATIRSEITKDNVTTALGYTPPTKDTVYTHPSYPSVNTYDLHKFVVDSTGHVQCSGRITKTDITSLGIPAQDTTYSAAGSSLGLVKSGGDVTISSGVITVNDDSHNHTIANVDGLQTALDAKASLTDAVLSTEQSLTDEQKTQARKNIGAGISNVKSYNDLSDIPCGEASSGLGTAFGSGDTLTWDGNTDGLESMDFYGTIYYRISTSALPKTLELSTIVGMSSSGAEIMIYTSDGDGFMMMALKSNTSIMIAMSVPEDNYLNLTFLKKGIYVMPPDATYGHLASLTVEGFSFTDIKQLDPKYLPDHTHTENVTVKQDTAPTVNLTMNDSSCETRLYKNASSTADYGTTLSDYKSDGTRDSLILCRNNALDKKLYINVGNDDGTSNTPYYLYGEHHKPTADEVGALSTSGGTVSGDVNIAGVIKANSQQAFYYATATNSQTIGTANATGGTTICCGSSANTNIQGANVKTNNLVPNASNTYTLGSTSARWKGIYSNANVDVSSDERLKRDITDLDNEALAKFVSGLNVVSYNYNDDPEDADARIGLVAQNVQAADPEIAKYFVSEDQNGMLSLKSADLVFPLIAAVQKLTARVAELEAKLVN